MKITAILTLLRMAYKLILRDLLKSAIDDPNSEWDDMVLKALDAMFSYAGE